MKIDLLIKQILKYYNFYILNKPNRPMIRLVQQLGKKPLVGVEIGTSKGCHAFDILYHLDIKTLYCIDPYVEYNDRLKINQHPVDYNFDMFKYIANEALSCFKDKYKFIYKTSDDAIDEIPNNLDFVYIDGNHSYEQVKRDIDTYYNKVKMGGIIGGHDFGLNFPGVIKAVLAFIIDNKIKLYYSESLDWWIVKE